MLISEGLTQWVLNKVPNEQAGLLVSVHPSLQAVLQTGMILILKQSLDFITPIQNPFLADIHQRKSFECWHSRPCTGAVKAVRTIRERSGESHSQGQG